MVVEAQDLARHTECTSINDFARLSGSENYNIQLWIRECVAGEVLIVMVGRQEFRIPSSPIQVRTHWNMKCVGQPKIVFTIREDDIV